MRVRWVKRDTAFLFVTKHHRHSKRPAGSIICFGVFNGPDLVGVSVIGRPVARMLGHNGDVVEVLRVCTDGTRNACSMLYGHAARFARLAGADEVVTYTLAEEDGASLRGAGWTERTERRARGGSWSRAGRSRNSTNTGRKRVWIRVVSR